MKASLLFPTWFVWTLTLLAALVHRHTIDVQTLQPSSSSASASQRTFLHHRTTNVAFTATRRRMAKEGSSDFKFDEKDCSNTNNSNDCHFNRKKTSSAADDDDASDDCFVFDYEAAATHYGEDADHLDAEFWDRFDAQNRARQKFGLHALSHEEYVVLQAETKAMGDQLSQDAIQAAFQQFDTNGDGVVSLQELQDGMRDILRTELMSEDHVETVMKHLDTSGDGVLQLDEMVGVNELRQRLEGVIKEEQAQLQLETTTEQQSPKEEEEKRQPGLLKSFLATFRLSDEDACESNFDCYRPQVCCDFHFKKFCCSSGIMAQELQLQYATVPVPQGI